MRTSVGFITAVQKICKEFMLYAMNRYINKYHRFLHDKIKFTEKADQKTT